MIRGRMLSRLRPAVELLIRNESGKSAVVEAIIDTGYNGEFHFVDDPTTPDEDETQIWGQPTSLVSPRFVRLSIQFSF